MVFLVNKGHIEWVRVTRCAQDGGLDVVRRHWHNGCEEGPLILVRPEVSIHKYTASVFTRMLLQWQCDQIAKTAFGHRILIGEQPVVGFELELPRAGASVADDGRTESACVPSRHAAGEENPGMRTIAGT